MSRDEEVFLPLTGLVMCESGRQMVDRGDPLPDDILPDEKKRLKDAGQVGSASDLFSPGVGDGGDEVDALVEAASPGNIEEQSDEELAAWAKAQTVDDLVAAASTPELAARLKEAEEAGKARKSAVEKLDKLASGDGDGGDASNPEE